MTLSDLLLRWAERDYRYTLRRKQPLSPESIAAVRSFRESEADDLPLPVQARARAEAANWMPPRGV